MTLSPSQGNDAAGLWKLLKDMVLPARTPGRPPKPAQTAASGPPISLNDPGKRWFSKPEWGTSCPTFNKKHLPKASHVKTASSSEINIRRTSRMPVGNRPPNGPLSPIFKSRVRSSSIFGVEMAAFLSKPISASGGRRPPPALMGFEEECGRSDPRNRRNLNPTLKNWR